MLLLRRMSLHLWPEHQHVSCVRRGSGALRGTRFVGRSCHLHVCVPVSVWLSQKRTFLFYFKGNNFGATLLANAEEADCCGG